MAENQQAIHQLLRLATQFVIGWVGYQKEQYPDIDGLLVLDDLIGFIGEKDFEEFVQPYMTEILSSLDVSVRFLHNDAAGMITAGHLERMGVNLFNFSFEHDVNEIRERAGDKVTLMGNIPPRDVLGAGTCGDIRQGVAQLLGSVADKRRLIVSGGGFTPGAFSEDKITAFREAVIEAR